MFKDPVFQALNDYKNTLDYDVIRHEYILIAEIHRCKQYESSSKVPELAKAVIFSLEAQLEELRRLHSTYLQMKFEEHLKTVPFWKRRAVRANPTAWKYWFYQKERAAAVEEVLAVINSTRKEPAT